MAARPKAGDTPAESQEAQAEKPSVEETSEKLNEALAAAVPADGEQPKPADDGRSHFDHGPRLWRVSCRSQASRNHGSAAD